MEKDIQLIFNKRVKISLAFVLFIFFVLWETGCGEKIRKGDVYKDPLKRFEVVSPANEMDLDNWGVAFSDSKNFFNYLIRAYDTPPLHSENQLTIANVISDLKSMMSHPEFEMKILREEPTRFKGFEAVNFDFSYTSKKEGLTRYYYSRLIRTENYVYWIYLVTLIGGEKTIIVSNENEVTSPSRVAHDFFNNINFLK